MAEQNSGQDILLGIGETSFNPKHAVAALEQQPADQQLAETRHVFRVLLDNASKPRQSSGNACVKLCGYVDLCARSNVEPLRRFAFEESTALYMFDFFIEWNEQDAHRSMRLVLDFLAHFISKNPVFETAASVRTKILTDSVSMVTEKSSRPSVKSSITALDYLLQKKLIFLDDILLTYGRVHRLPSDHVVEWDVIVTQIFEWMQLHQVCPIAGKFLVTVFTEAWDELGQGRFGPKAWHRFISQGMRSNPELLEPIKLYVFIPLFKADRAGALRYLGDLSSRQTLTAGKGAQGLDHNSMLWLAMLEAGKKVGVVDEPGTGVASKPDVEGQLDAKTLEDVVCHESQEARASAVSIMIASPSSTRPYTSEVLDLLRNHLPSFHADSDAKFRYDVLGHSRNMIKRIQGALESLRRDYDRALKKSQKTPINQETPTGTGSAKAKSPQAVVSGLRKSLQQHERFVGWYMNFLKAELVPTASYQRHITALKAMSFLLKSSLPHDLNAMSHGDSSASFIDSSWLRSILDLIMDPFDDVREAAASLIMQLPVHDEEMESTEHVGIPNATMQAELKYFTRRAEKLSRQTARADHSDGVARSYELLWRWSTEPEERLEVPERILTGLEAKLFAAESDLASAVLDAPVHGSFASLRFLWSSLSGKPLLEEELEDLQDFQNRAISCCRRIWHCVQHVLCDDSPEGHLPEELEEVEGLDTKDLLSYSFRAIHESSHLLKAIASNARHGSTSGLLAPSRQNFEEIGELTFTELSNLRHRGAFTTVTQTFAACCQLVKYFPTAGDEADNLLDTWYQGALKCIHTQASTTRRSAGIPALIVGILSSHSEKPSFETVIHELRAIAEIPAFSSETDGSNLPQVHALNSLKDIFRTSFLSKRAEPYLTECLQLAADSLKSEVWAIRNCGLLLLRSLIDCLFGTNESKTSMEAGWDGRTTRISYHKFPALPSVLVNLLESGQRSQGALLGTQTAESVFPALDIIRRAGPPEADRERLYRAIVWYLGSQIWHVREIAARTLCSFLLQPDWIERVTKLISDAGRSANMLHGALLTLKFLLERLLEVMPHRLYDQYPDALYDLLEDIFVSNECLKTCNEARAVYIEVVGIFNHLGTSEDAPTIELPADLNTPSALLNSSLAQVTTKHLVRQSNLELVELKDNLMTALKKDVNVSCTILEALLTSDPPEDDLAGLMLFKTYGEICFETDAPEPRRLALECLTRLLDKFLQRGPDSLEALPDNEALYMIWAFLNTKSLNPSLSDSITRFSGPLIAVVGSRVEKAPGALLMRWLRLWGSMSSEAGLAERTFDTRLAAINAIGSFSSAVSLPTDPSPGAVDSAHLPWLLAMYDALNDDDDEVRDAAAVAASPILGQSLVPIEAAARLLRWMVKAYGRGAEFRAHVASRIVGHPAPLLSPVDLSKLEADGDDGDKLLAQRALDNWTSAFDQLRPAMRLDDALFVVEEQNLYVDEIREVGRWCEAFRALPPPASAANDQDGGQRPAAAIKIQVSTGSSSADQDPAAHALATWALFGLRTLTTLADTEGHDGALGWTAKPAVFAICARVLRAAAALLATTARGNRTDSTPATPISSPSVGTAGSRASWWGGAPAAPAPQPVVPQEPEEGELIGEIRDELRRFVEVGRRRGVHGLLLGMCRS